MLCCEPDVRTKRLELNNLNGVQVFFGFEELMSSRKRARRDKGSKRKSVKTYKSKRATATRTAAVERPMKYAEKKNIENNLDATGSTAETAIAPIACLVITTQGAGATNRLGRRILVKSIFVRGRVYCPSNMTGVGAMRIIIFQDKEPNGAVPTITQLLVTDHIVSLSNLGNSKRFKILAEIGTPNGCMMSSDTDEGFLFERYIKCNIPVVYNDVNTSGTALDVLTNGIYAAIYLGCGGVLSNPPLLSCRCRVRFVDY